MAHILVVDDDRSLSMLYEQELVDEGHDVSLATDGFEALKFLEQQKPDLVVLDIAMPGMDGIETLWRILGKRRTLPIILNSAYSQYQSNYMTWPANAYVVKSGDLTELKAKINELLGVFATK
jgi:DNA-binding response OmpR family regulator